MANLTTEAEITEAAAEGSGFRKSLVIVILSEAVVGGQKSWTEMIRTEITEIRRSDSSHLSGNAG